MSRCQLTVMQRGFLDGGPTTRSRSKRLEGGISDPEHGSISEAGEASEPSGPSVERTEGEFLSPRQFWLEFVLERKPVLIDGHLPERSWKATRKWTDDYMWKHAVSFPSLQ